MISLRHLPNFHMYIYIYIDCEFFLNGTQTFAKFTEVCLVLRRHINIAHSATPFLAFRKWSRGSMQDLSRKCEYRWYG